MNNLDSIVEYEAFLADLTSTKYTLVYFGASQLLETTIETIHTIKPQYVCDNDILKHEKEIFGYKVHNPFKLFNENKLFIVIVTSMYFYEINEQLKEYPNVKIVKPSFYLKQLEESSIPNTPSVLCNEYIINNSLGLDIKIYFNSNTASKLHFYDYLSYCNQKIIQNNTDSIDLFFTKYNCTFSNYKKILEWNIFKVLDEDKKQIIIHSVIPDTTIIDKTEEIINIFEAEKFKITNLTRKTKRTKEHALLIHLYYVDMIDEIYKNVQDSLDIFDVFINVTIDCSLVDIKKLLFLFPYAQISIYENRGRDILPFLHVYNTIYNLGYKSFCKIHTKKSPSRKDFGQKWSAKLRESLFRNKKKILKNFSQNEKIAYVNLDSKRDYEKDKPTFFYQENLLLLCKIFNLQFNDNFIFPAGTMFWAPTISLRPLHETIIDEKLFVIESGILDGQIEHALERFFGFLIKHNEYDLVGLE